MRQIKSSIWRFAILLIAILGMPKMINAQKPGFADSTFTNIKLRGIGPALMSGRIADIAIHPMDNSTWYVAVGSGGVWKTVNAGTTWEPVFDNESSYSIGCVTIDLKNTNTIWVGTGENVGGRHVGYGDGIYRSTDAGKSWKNMGLKKSEHISKIIVHPENSNVVWVAAQGPLWSSGGERGVYKTTDGGKNWKKVLGDNEWTGATDLLIDPRNPDRLYAATWQRHRNVAAYLGGGPETAIYRSNDGGENWTRLKNGLPSSSMGKIGLAISPQKPDILYAAIELERRTGGVYKSTDRGESWTKQSDAVAGGTGPHYYQELYASPHHFDRIYLMDVVMQVSEDGGKTFTRQNTTNKHVDNHAMAFVPNDPEYMLVGCDGGLYETFDNAKTWKYVANLPVTQFYKVALDDAEPFYTVYGGTQDNNTQGGPSRTMNNYGIRNADWFITLFGDGHQPATEPGNPDIMYSHWQEGNLTRVDRKTGEVVYIQPQPAEGDPHERYNWDAPILVSPHSPTRLYHGSYRVWRSGDRGDTWTPVSGDLTRNQERIELPIMGKQQSWDNPWDLFAMSTYSTITSLSESPVKEGLIYAGTDDGLIQVTEDGGENWRKVEASDLPGVPETAFVNDIKADLFDENTVYVALDNHKFGDLSPYLLKSTDKGKSWQSIVSNIPDRTLIWRLVQDHKKPELLFTGTEFGVYFTLDGGKKWAKLKGGVPTISFRDLAIQKREDDLVGATFGRGFYILDDYSFLREVSSETFEKEAVLFDLRDAWWYMEKPILDFGSGKASQGDAYYIAPNPPFGAVFTFYLGDKYQTLEESRKEKEKALRKQDTDIPFPGWDALEDERRQEKPVIWLIIKDDEGNVVRRISAPVSQGFNRIAWDLRYPAQVSLDLDINPKPKELTAPSGFLVAPGTYTAILSKQIEGKVTPLSGPVSFEVKPLQEGALEGAPHEKTVAFWKNISQVQKQLRAVSSTLRDAKKRVNAMQVAAARSVSDPGAFENQLYEVEQQIYSLEEKLSGNQSKNLIGEKTDPTAAERINKALLGTRTATYGPTPTHEKSLELGVQKLKEIRDELVVITETALPEIEKKLEEAGAPWIEGQAVPD